MASALAAEGAAGRQQRLVAEPADALHSRALVDATLAQTANARYQVQRRSALVEEVKAADAAHARWCEQAVTAFEAAIDAYESGTVASLEQLARGTSLGVDLDLSEQLALRTAAVDICTDRLTAQLDALRLKQLPPGTRDQPRDVKGLELAKVDRPPRKGEPARANDAARSPAAPAAGCEEAGAGAGGAGAEEMPSAEPPSAEGATTGDAGAAGAAAQPEAARDGGTAGGGLSLSDATAAMVAASDGGDGSWMRARPLRDASSRLRDELLALRELKPTADGPRALDAPSGRVVIDGSLVGSNGGALPPLLLLMVESLQLCNVEVEVVLSGPRELGPPYLAKRAGASSQRSLHSAVESVLSDAAMPELPPRETPPTFVLCVSPPATSNGTALPLGACSSAACAGLEGSRLGFILLNAEGGLELGSWVASEGGGRSATACPYPSLEALLDAMLPPRAVPSGPAVEPWHASWRRWGAFELSSDAAVAAILEISEDLRASGLAASSQASSGEQRTLGARLVGADCRAAAGGAVEVGADSEERLNSRPHPHLSPSPSLSP